MSNILIEANNISKVYDPDILLKRGKNIYALNNVNFELQKGDLSEILFSVWRRHNSDEVHIVW